MASDGSQFYSANAGSLGNLGRITSSSACIGWVSAGSPTPALLAEYVSMDADGFTINVTTPDVSFGAFYEAIQ